MQTILPKVLEKLAVRAAEMYLLVDAADLESRIYLIQCCSLQQEELQQDSKVGNSRSYLFLCSSVASKEVLEASGLQMLAVAVVVRVLPKMTFSSVEGGILREASSLVSRRDYLIGLWSPYVMPMILLKV